ncbi:hypothetical protein DFH08DRAFT_1084808 [Mycena albidolilacea]|uniref:Uncharacterized protein n=1 Tax=Mycena albidolilacea TaxID=1033008 RepID=A0AAD6ZJZ1_9AGAR|nr:hypothetical protein DFH08DRAFT_1084808 [Mycena albidolilacea]
MLLPLAALALFAAASISGPAFVLFRSIQRVVQPPTPVDIPPEYETVAAKAANFLYALFLRAFASIVASARQSQPATLLPVFRDQSPLTPPAAPIDTSRALPAAEVVPMNVAEPKVEVTEPPVVSAVGHGEVAEADANAMRSVPLPSSKRRTQRVSQSHRAYVDFTLGWDDIWPERCLPSHVKYTYNSYFNAFAVSTSHEPTPSPPLCDVCADSDVSSDSDDSEVDALELASRSADDDLLWAFYSLSISSTSSALSPSPCSPLEQFPPAGLSPFCPPPLSSPSLSQTPTTTTWRLEWY